MDGVGSNQATDRSNETQMTKHSMTNVDIHGLYREADNAGDYKQMAICTLAMHGRAALRTFAVGTSERILLSSGATKAWARKEVAEVLIAWSAEAEAYDQDYGLAYLNNY